MIKLPNINNLPVMLKTNKANIEFIAGMGCIGFGGVAAIIKAPKIGEAVKEAKLELSTITKETPMKEKLLTTKDAVLPVLKESAIPLAFVGGGMVLAGKGHMDLNTEKKAALASLSSAMAIAAKARKELSQKYGTEGIEAFIPHEVIEVDETIMENGEEKTVTKNYNVIDADNLGDFIFIWDSDTTELYTNDDGCNLRSVSQAIMGCSGKLRSRGKYGFIAMHEILNALYLSKSIRPIHLTTGYFNSNGTEEENPITYTFYQNRFHRVDYDEFGKQIYVPVNVLEFTNVKNILDKVTDTNGTSHCSKISFDPSKNYELIEN